MKKGFRRKGDAEPGPTGSLGGYHPKGRRKGQKLRLPVGRNSILGECGLPGMVSAARNCGLGADRVNFAAVAAEIAKACASTALVYVSPDGSGTGYRAFGFGFVSPIHLAKSPTAAGSWQMTEGTERR